MALSIKCNKSESCGPYHEEREVNVDLVLICPKLRNVVGRSPGHTANMRELQLHGSFTLKAVSVTSKRHPRTATARLERKKIKDEALIFR
jgi:hypothetical protein